MTIKEQLVIEFNNLLNQTNDTDFNTVKNRLTKIIFSNSVEEDHLDVFVGEFELFCKDFVDSGFLESKKYLLLNSFEGILVSLDTFQQD